jgi:phosphonate transport system substrate-binding protein
MGRTRNITLRIALLGWMVALGPAVAQQNASAGATGIEAHRLRHARLYGVSSKQELNHVNQDDASAALKVWFDLMGREKGFILDSKVDVVDSVREIRERLQSHTVDLLVLDVPGYLELESSRLIVPVLTHARGAREGALYSYVLLVNPSSAATTIAGLRGKKILVSSRNGLNTGAVWIDVLLGKEKLGRAASFFASIKVPDKPQACILPLFFGSVDACVVDEVNLSLAKEMNPQLGQLRVLARSRPMIESVIAMPAEPVPFQKVMMDAMLSLHENPRGRQLLLVFKTDRLVPIQPGDLDSGRELWHDYGRLAGSAPNRPASSASAPAVAGNQVDRGQEGH